MVRIAWYAGDPRLDIYKVLPRATKVFFLRLGFQSSLLAQSSNMGLIRNFAALLAASTVVSASPVVKSHAKRDVDVNTWNSTCTNPTQRKSWHYMTDAEKKAYIDAELCLINTPATLGFAGAQSKFDELQYSHIHQSNVVHYSVSLR